MRRIIMSLVAETKLYGRVLELIHDQFNNQYVVYLDEKCVAEFYSTELDMAFESYQDLLNHLVVSELNNATKIVDSIASGDDNDKSEEEEVA